MQSYSEFIEESWLSGERNIRFPMSQHPALRVQSHINSLNSQGVKPREVTVHPSQLRATQGVVRRDHTKGPKRDPVYPDYADKPVGGIDRDGNFHVVDGHHRSESSFSRKKPIRVYAWDY